jgi:hypothetical protein
MALWRNRLAAVAEVVALVLGFQGVALPVYLSVLVALAV